MNTGMWCGNMKEKVHFKDLGADVMITLKSVLKK
jgi:hypothetical protein